MTKNPMFHDKTKDIEIRYHFIRDMVQKRVVKHVPIEEQVADVLTKPLARIKFEYFRDKLGLVRKDLSRKRDSQQMLDAVVSRSV